MCMVCTRKRRNILKDRARSVRNLQDWYFRNAESIIRNLNCRRQLVEQQEEDDDGVDSDTSLVPSGQNTEEETWSIISQNWDGF